MNRALLGAIRKGVVARAAGQLRTSCPYSDVRKLDGRLTWGRAFRRAWFQGYDGSLTDTDRRALMPAFQVIPKIGTRRKQWLIVNEHGGLIAEFTGTHLQAKKEAKLQALAQR